LNDSVNVQPYQNKNKEQQEASTSAAEVNSLGSVNEIRLSEI
jgi:ParB family chromosome partitioning protein